MIIKVMTSKSEKRSYIVTLKRKGTLHQKIQDRKPRTSVNHSYHKVTFVARPKPSHTRLEGVKNLGSTEIHFVGFRKS